MATEMSMETRGRGRIRVLKDSCEMHSPMITVEDKSGIRRNVYDKKNLHLESNMRYPTR